MFVKKFDDFIFHTVMVNNCFSIFPESQCPPCHKEKNDIDDSFEYEHASIKKLIYILYDINISLL